MKKWHLKQNQPVLKEIFKDPPILSYRKGRSLKDILVRAKIWRSSITNLDQWESCLACLFTSQLAYLSRCSAFHFFLRQDVITRTSYCLFPINWKKLPPHRAGRCTNDTNGPKPQVRLPQLAKLRELTESKSILYRAQNSPSLFIYNHLRSIDSRRGLRFFVLDLVSTCIDTR